LPFDALSAPRMAATFDATVMATTSI